MSKLPKEVYSNHNAGIMMIAIIPLLIVGGLGVMSLDFMALLSQQQIIGGSIFVLGFFTYTTGRYIDD